MTNPSTHLLIVDDEEAHVEAIRRAFDDAGAHVTIESVGTLREFHACVQARRPDLALIDLNLPDGRAVDVLTQPPEDAPFPILVMTAFGNQQIVVEVMKAGALDYVVKSPAAFALMPRTVEQALREWGLLQNHRRAEQARQESEATLQCILGSTADGILAVDNKGKVLKTNQQFARLWRIPQAVLDSGNDQTLLNCILDQLSSPEAFLEKVRRLYGTTALDTDTLCFKDGRVFERYSAPLLMGGALAGRVWSFRDITARKQAEAAIQASEQQLKAYLDNAGDAIYIVEAGTGRIRNCNARGCHDLGYSRDELLNLCTADIENRISIEEVTAIHQQLKPGETSTVTGEHRRKDGSTFPVEIRLSSLAPAQPELIISIVRDITERKQAEAALRESEALFSTTFHSIPIPVSISDQASDAWVEVNAAFLNVTGYTRAEIIGHTFRELNLWEHIEDRDKMRAILSAQGRVNDFEVDIHKKNGAIGTMLISVEKVDLAGKPYLLVMGKEITERKQTESALRQSEERFRTLLEQAPMAICLSRDGIGLYANQKLQKMFGFHSVEEAVGRPIFEYFAPQCQAESKERTLQRSLGLPVPAEFESVGRRADGSEFPLQVTVESVQLSDGVANMAFLVDITERKRAEEALRSYHILVENIPDWVWEVNAQGLYTYASPAVRNILGYAPEEVVGRHPYDFMPAEEARRVGALFAELAAQHKAFVAVENVNRHSDGRLVVLETSGNPIFGNNGEFLGYRGIDRDITARKQAEEAQARLATAVAQAAETIVITDVKGTILYANPAFAKVTGYSCAEALGKNPRILRSGKHSAEFYRQLWATLTAGQVWSGHLINKRKDGTLIEEEATISPVLDSAGTIVNYVAVKRDVTREVALEAQNRQAAKMEAVGQLAGGVAHDFNNQLQVILGCTEVILGNLPPDHALRDDLQEIRKAARHSADLTRQLLAFSRKQMIAPVVLDVSAAISGSLKMLGRLIGENIRLNFTLAQDTGAVFMDPSQWDQILANLAVNARDAIAGTGTIFIEAAPRTLAEADCRDKTDFVTPGDYVVLTFRDDGPGMTPEIQGHIFEPFFTTKGVGKGTGMGLATVYGIVKQNHGAISVQSAPGQGATFSIYLPRASSAAVAATAKLAERIPTGTETILLVEDEESVLSLLQRTLVRQGYHILPAAAPAEALRVCSSHPAPIDLLLTDVIMPEMGGRDLAERIQKLRPGIRVLFMSGYTADIMEQQGHMPAGLHVMQKPFTSAILAQRIRAALDAPPPPRRRPELGALGRAASPKPPQRSGCFIWFVVSRRNVWVEPDPNCCRVWVGLSGGALGHRALPRQGQRNGFCVSACGAFPCLEKCRCAFPLAAVCGAGPPAQARGRQARKGRRTQHDNEHQTRRQLPLGRARAGRGDAAARSGLRPHPHGARIQGLGGRRRIQRRPRPAPLLRPAHQRRHRRRG